MRRLIPMALFGVLFLVALPVSSPAQDDIDDVDEAGIEPVDINRAPLDELRYVPGMDEGLARSIVAWRLQAGPLDSVEALYASPEIDPARLIAVRPWLVATPARGPTEARVQSSLRSAGKGLRRETKASFVRHRSGLSVRIREGYSDARQATFRFQTRLGPIGVDGGVSERTDGLGLLAGVSGRRPARGVLAPATGAFLAPEPERLRRTAPIPGGRSLKGVSVDITDVFAGVFQHDSKSVLLLGGQVQPGGLVLFLPRVLRFDGRAWAGVAARGALAGAPYHLEFARDPSARVRYGLALGSPAGSDVRFSLSTIGGHTAFNNPLALDPGNRNESALLVRSRLRRGLALEVEVRGAVDPATSRRAWERQFGFGRLKIEASPGRGWSMSGETRIEHVGAPGPSEASGADERRHTARLRVGRDRGRSHLRFDWHGRLVFLTPAAPEASTVIDGVRDVVAARGRWAVAESLWIGAGVARFQTPAASPATIYEERPRGVGPAVTVRGTGARVHLAFELSSPVGRLGAYLARASPAAGNAQLEGAAIVTFEFGRR